LCFCISLYLYLIDKYIMNFVVHFAWYACVMFVMRHSHFSSFVVHSHNCFLINCLYSLFILLLLSLNLAFSWVRLVRLVCCGCLVCYHSVQSNAMSLLNLSIVDIFCVITQYNRMWCECKCRMENPCRILNDNLLPIALRLLKNVCK